MLVVYKGSAFIGIALFQSLFIMIIYPSDIIANIYRIFALFVKMVVIMSIPHWFEFAKDKWAQVYKTTGTPCSCWMCRGEESTTSKDINKRFMRITKRTRNIRCLMKG